MENCKERNYYEDEISFIDLFKILKKQKKFIIIPTIISLILSLIAGFIVKQDYESVLEIRPNNEYIATYDESIDGIVNSYDLREYIVKKNGFQNDYTHLMGKKVVDISDVIYWIDEITKIKIQTSQANSSGTITVEVKSKDKEFSKRLAMAYYTDLKEYMKIKRDEYYGRKVPYLEEKVKILGEKITEQNKNLQIMNGKINISALDTSIEKDIVAYETTMSELIDAKMEKSEYRNSISLVKKPKIAKKPSMNKKIMYPLIGTIVGIIFGVLLAFLINMIESEKKKTI